MVLLCYELKICVPPKFQNYVEVLTLDVMVFGDGLGMGLGLAEIMEVSPNVGLVSSEEEIPDSSLSLSDM